MPATAGLSPLYSRQGYWSPSSQGDNSYNYPLSNCGIGFIFRHINSIFLTAKPDPPPKTGFLLRYTKRRTECPWFPCASPFSRQWRRPRKHDQKSRGISLPTPIDCRLRRRNPHKSRECPMRKRGDVLNLRASASAVVRATTWFLNASCCQI